MAEAGSDIGKGAPPIADVDWRARIRDRLAGTQPLHGAEHWLVPGRTAEESREFLKHFSTTPVPAAVLVPLVERDGDLTVLLTQRATQLKNHAGQISFPGGRVESSDRSPRDAALREAHEEIGLDPGFVSIAGYLPDHVIVSGFLVTPVVAFVRPGFELLLDSGEVESTFEVPLSFLFDPQNHRTRRRRIGASEYEIDVIDIPFGEHNIWGATAGMIFTLYRMCMEDRSSG
ncbi:MAG: CoA pyrophosphatase [Gammaproteobacteria bacterium]